MNRFEHIQYDDQTRSLQELCKRHFKIIESFVGALPESREKSLVFTRLEEAYMWFGKALRDGQMKRDLEKEKTS